MGQSDWWLTLCALGILAASFRGVRSCQDEITINVILLEDEESPWSLNFVREEILNAIETDSAINAAQGNKIKKGCLHVLYRHNYGAYYNIVAL